MKLILDEATHTYYADGKVVPGVTSVLGTLHDWKKVDPEVLRKACERGTNVHLACEYFDKGTLEESSVAHDERGYLEGWKKFCAQHRPIWTDIEHLVFHQVHLYAGTLDRRGSMDYNGARLERAHVDVKTGPEHPVMGLQLAAYVAASGDHLRTPRFTCHLKPNGNYKLVPWTDPSDWAYFLSLLNLDNFRRTHDL